MRFPIALIVMFFSLFTHIARGTPEQEFWRWFEKNDASLFDFEKDQKAVFDRLTTAMHRVHPSLTFEFGPKQGDSREFVISADGIKDAFPKVISLHAAAPKLPRWTRRAENRDARGERSGFTIVRHPIELAPISQAAK